MGGLERTKRRVVCVRAGRGFGGVGWWWGACRARPQLFCPSGPPRDTQTNQSTWPGSCQQNVDFFRTGAAPLLTSQTPQISAREKERETYLCNWLVSRKCVTVTIWNISDTMHAQAKYDDKVDAIPSFLVLAHWVVESPFKSHVALSIKTAFGIYIFFLNICFQQIFARYLFFVIYLYKVPDLVCFLGSVIF